MKKQAMKKKIPALLLAPLFAITLTALAQQSSSEAPYKNPNLPLEQRVQDLVSRMTLEEKVSQLGHTGAAIPRLGVPEYNWWSEGLHGVARADYATVFPQAIAMAATFDEPLMHRVAGVISTEFRAKYYATLHPDGSSDWYRGLTVWSPNINIFRDPRWGRGQETYGEDPYLTSRMGVAFITGLQGNDPTYLKTVATAKHFAVHSGPETTRHTVDVQASRHDMEDTYLPAFRAAITEAKADSVMCAYNSLNGQPACANTTLLQQHLRKDWDFQGYVVSDCGAVHDIYDGHRFTKTPEAGVAAALKAGTDLICGFPFTRVTEEPNYALGAVRSGLLSSADLDRALIRQFTARFRLGMFDPPSMVPYSKISPTENDTEAHRQLALQAAREAIVLLKNKDHFLPLKTAYPTIAVIGPDADNLDALTGNYNGIPSKPVTVLEGIRTRFAQSKIVYVQGTGLIAPVANPVPGEALYSDQSRQEHGLKGEYFANTQLEGAPALTRTDSSVNFSWGTSGAAPEMLKNYSVRWTGVLVAPKTGDYYIGFTGLDGYRLWLDGQSLVEDWSTHDLASTQTAKFHLEQGRPYSLKIEYFQTTRAAEARLVWTMPGEDGQDAVDAAKNADLSVVVLGLSPRIEGEEMHLNTEGFSGGDRTALDLPAPQQKLLERIYAAGKPAILVLLNGSAVSVNWADRNLPAILEAWYPGEEGGTAVAEALAGDFSPSGRLPVTFYKSTDQLPAFDDYSMARRTYRYFEGAPLYPFGYGLSYTSFSYSNLQVPPTVAAKGEATVSVDVTNTGTTAGDEVAQLYLTHPGIPGAPVRALAGFQRLHLEPGQKTTVYFTLRERQLSIVDTAGVRRVAPGPVEVWVGGGQPISSSQGLQTAGAKTQFAIAGEKTLPD